MAWSTKILMPFLSFLDSLLQGAGFFFFFFQKSKVLIIWHKTCQTKTSLVWGALPSEYSE